MLALDDRRIAVPFEATVMLDAQIKRVDQRRAGVVGAGPGAHDSGSVARPLVTPLNALLDVLCVRRARQVRRVAAESVRATGTACARLVGGVAGVIDGQAVLDRPMRQLPCENVGMALLMVAAQLAVTVRSWLTKPQPALIWAALVNIGPKECVSIPSIKLVGPYKRGGCHGRHLF